MIILKKSLFVVLLAVVFVMLLSSRSYARIEGEGLTISPPVNELTVKAGEKVEQTIKVTNPTSATMEVYPQVLNFEAKGDSGEPNFYPADEENKKFALAGWITYNQMKLALTPEQVVEFHYQINAPKDAEPGGHYGAIFFSTEPPKPKGEVSQVSISSMIGSLILVKVPGVIVEKGYVEDFSARKLHLKLPVAFTTRIANVGTVHFKPKGEITIKNWRGKVLDRATFNEAGGNVLPDSTRKFSENWARQTSFFKTPAGRFTATLRIVYGENDKTLDGQLAFWVIPWWLILLVAVIVLLVIGLVLFVKRKRKKKKENYLQYEKKDKTQTVPDSR